MSQQSNVEYEFCDWLPLAPVESGTNLLVTEPKIGGSHRVALSLLEGAGFEGTMFITTEKTGRETIDIFERCGGRYTKNRMAVIDCSEGGRESPPLNIRTLSSPADLTGIGMVFSSLYEQLYSSGINQVRTGFYTLSSLLLYVDDFRTVTRFLHTVTGRINAAGGLGVFILDPETQDEQVLRTVEHSFDGRVDIRATDAESSEHELRTRGLSNQPTDWKPFVLPQ